MVRPGYKQTEIGIIPDDWEICIAKDLYLKARIGWQGLKKEEYLENGDYYLVTGTDFCDNRINWENCHYVEKERYEQDKNIQLSIGDVLITKDGSIGKTAFVDALSKPATLNSGIFLVRTKNDKINQTYLYFIFKSEYFNKFLKDLTAGSTIVHLYQKDFVTFKYPIPNNKEQELIAKSLIDLDNMISSLEKLIDKKKSIKQGTMQELLTGKKRLPEFVGKWKKINLSKCSKIKARIGWQGLTTNEYLDSGFAYLITGTDFVNGKIDWDNCHYVAKDRFDQDKNIQIQNDDILITKDGSLGKTALVKGLNKPATLNSGVFVIRPTQESYDPTFVYYILSSFVFKDFLDHLSAGSTIIHLYQKDINKFELLIPPTIEEQTAIASILSDMDNEIEALEQKLAKTRQIKQGMMQQLLTGKIRLV